MAAGSCGHGLGSFVLGKWDDVAEEVKGVFVALWGPSKCSRRPETAM